MLTIKQLLDDPSTSHWLRDALKAALERDPVDAANDAELLAELLDRRARQAVVSASAIGVKD